MEFEHIHLLEGAFVQEQFDAFACRGLTFGVLLLDGFFATAEACFLAKLDKLLYLFKLFAHIL